MGSHGPFGPLWAPKPPTTRLHARLDLGPWAGVGTHKLGLTQLSGRHPSTRQAPNMQLWPNMPQCLKYATILQICINAPNMQQYIKHATMLQIYHNAPNMQRSAKNATMAQTCHNAPRCNNAPICHNVPICPNAPMHPFSPLPLGP